MYMLLSIEDYNYKYFETDCLKIDKVIKVFKKYNLPIYRNIIKDTFNNVIINGVYTEINGIMFSVIVGQNMSCDSDVLDSYEVYDYTKNDIIGCRYLSWIENRIKDKLNLFENSKEK